MVNRVGHCVQGITHDHEVISFLLVGHCNAEASPSRLAVDDVRVCLKPAALAFEQVASLPGAFILATLPSALLFALHRLTYSTEDSETQKLMRMSGIGTYWS